MKAAIDLAREVLDHEIVDADEVSCGIVDDVALEERPDGTLAPTHLIVGIGAWSARLPALLSYLVRWLGGNATVRVPWSEIERVGETIALRSRASALGLGKADRKAGRWLSRLPGA